MSTLYELKDNYLALEALDPDDDESFAEAISNSLAEIKDDFETKSINIIKYEKNLLAESKAIDEEIKRLQTKKKITKNRIDSMREYLKTNMELTGINKISCPLFTISMRRTKGLVIIDDETLVPRGYVVTTIIDKIDKNSIYAALKDGDNVPGVHLEENKGLFIK